MVKNVLSTKLLKTLYYTLIHPHLNYGCILWGVAYKKHIHTLEVLQNKAIRIISKAKYNASTKPLYKNLQMLTLQDMFNMEIAKFMYQNSTGELPRPLQEHFISNINIHTHNTRQKNDFHMRRLTTLTAMKNLEHSGPKIWSKIPPSVKTLNNITRFVKAIKKNYIEAYKM
jgi:hypothetical protein